MRGQYHTHRPWRLSAECPECGAGLRIRRRRRDGERFLGCRRYPGCRYATDYDAVLGGLALDEAHRELDELRCGRAPAPVDLGRELRAVIAVAHPDKWPQASELAHEVTSRLTELRRRVAA